jgi:hypothetical protein
MARRLGIGRRTVLLLASALVAVAGGMAFLSFLTACRCNTLK